MFTAISRYNNDHHFIEQSILAAIASFSLGLLTFIHHQDNSNYESLHADLKCLQKSNQKLLLEATTRRQNDDELLQTIRKAHLHFLQTFQKFNKENVQFIAGHNREVVQAILKANLMMVDIQKNNAHDILDQIGKANDALFQKQQAAAQQIIQTEERLLRRWASRNIPLTTLYHNIHNVHAPHQQLLIPNHQQLLIPNHQQLLIPNQQQLLIPNQQQLLIPNQQQLLIPNQQQEHH